MAGWNKIYVVGDGKQKSQPAPVPQKSRLPKPRRRGVRYNWVLVFMAFSFFAGAYFGLGEDNEMEQFVGEEFAKTIMWSSAGTEFLSSSSASQNIDHCWSKYTLKYTRHFKECMERREIELTSIKKTLARGRIDLYDPTNRDNGRITPKFNLVYSDGSNGDLLVSLNIFPWKKEVKLITVYYMTGIKDEC